MVREDIKPILSPKSIAVIGASRRSGAVGNRIVKNILESGFKGPIYPINPKADKIHGLKCYPSVLKVEGDVDLAVVAVPARIVPEVVEEAGVKGVKGLIVISAGFREIGEEGAKLEKEVLTLCRKYGMRMVGPNCLGVINTSVPMNTTFASSQPIPGSIAFLSQSGALCTAVIDWAPKEGLGFSVIVSLGNSADLNVVDFIEALKEDENTRVIACYIEGISEGDRFVKAVGEVSRKKPVVILKAGLTSMGIRAVSSHTGSMAGSAVAYSTVFKRMGVIQVDSVEDLFNYARAFASQPIPEGRGLAILTNAGGPGIVATDSCEKSGLRLAWLSQETIEKLRAILPEQASVINPVDVLGDASAERYKQALQILLDDPGVNSVIVILTPQAVTQPVETAKAILEVYRSNPKKPILAVFMGGKAVAEAVKILRDNGIPVYEFPEEAVKTVEGMVRYAEYLREPLEQEIPEFERDMDTVRRIIERARLEGRTVLLGPEARLVMKAYGLKVPESGFAQNIRQALAIANKIGYPVALKVVSPHILHKTDVGGIVLNIRSDYELEEAYDSIMRNVAALMPQARIYGVEVQEMVSRGKEVIIGMHRDMQFGPLIMFGLGGIYVNLIKDVSFRLAPIGRKEAYDMITETKAYTLLRGFRGEPPSDIDSVVDTLVRVSRLALDFKEIADLDINPLIVYEKGKNSLALDVKITLSFI
ncbi:MAG: acyl-CoA synthetase [Candidatus Bathyarchaeota archaeon B24]|nr:MAG: acyl-CoA synthetase [Candidatus Bathyarchaeota archaeon B24]